MADFPDSIMRPPANAAVSVFRPSVPGYEVTGESGRGGMGVVYRAPQEALGSRHGRPPN